MSKINDNNGFDKIPPQAIDVEEAVLGALILESDSFEKVSGLLSAEMFYKTEHQYLYSVINEMYQKHKVIDLLTVTTKLKDTGKLTDFGGPLYLTQLTSRVASAAHIIHHARIIAQKYIQREYIRVGSILQQMAYDDTDPDDISMVWKDFENSFSSLVIGGDFGSCQRKVLIETLEGLEKDCTDRLRGVVPGIKTGFAKLDSITGGFNPGQLIIVGARPGQGKTSLGLHFTKEAAIAGKRVLFISLEMLKVDLQKILLSSLSKVDRIKIRDSQLNDEDWSDINKAVGTLESLEVFWVDNPNLNINQLQAIIKHHVKRNNIDLVVIDYLQLINSLPGAKNNFREQEIAGMSRVLKAITLSEHIPLICLCQLNRQAEGEAPKLHHLRESGSIEQDADVVLMPWKPGSNGKKDRDGQDVPESLIEIIVAKNRRGRTGPIEIYENGQMTCFAEEYFNQ